MGTTSVNPNPPAFPEEVMLPGGWGSYRVTEYPCSSRDIPQQIPIIPAPITAQSGFWSGDIRLLENWLLAP
jgi:hypothetical protein